MAVTFAMDLAYLIVDKPADYDAQEAKETLSKYAGADSDSQSPADENADAAIGKGQDYPNIIVIMDEAFSDLAVLGDFQTSEDCMPFVHKMMAGAGNTVSGWLNVSVCGGNTANTEFEFLTGHTMRFLPGGSIPYQQYVREETDSLAWQLRGLGYRTIAMHPYNASGRCIRFWALRRFIR